MSSKILCLGGNKISKYYRINDRIQARELRVIDAEGTQLGIISREEALAKAAEQELDLVEVAEHAQPPVARIIDFEKFKYQEDKKEQAARKKIHEVELKEVWLSPRIAAHDLETRLKKANEFLEEGNKVKLTVKFKGREMVHPEQGYKVVDSALKYWGEKVSIERETKFEGRNLTTIVGISRGKPKKEEGERTSSVSQPVEEKVIEQGT